MENKILMWLRGFAPFAGMMTEFVGVTPGSCGLFPRGQTCRVIATNTEGKETLACSREYHIHLRAVPGASAAALVDDFCRWVETGVAALRLGQNARAAVKRAFLSQKEQTGTALYQITLELTWESVASRGRTDLYTINSQKLITPDQPVTMTVKTREHPSSGYDEAGVYHRYEAKNISRWQFIYTGITGEEKQFLADLLLDTGDFLFTHPDGDVPVRCHRETWTANLEGPDRWTCRFSVVEV